MTTPFIIVQFSTSINLQDASGQTKTTLEHRMVRISERTIRFQAAWPQREWAAMDAFSEQIREHHWYSIGQATPMPMALAFSQTGGVFYGNIEQAPKGDQRFQSMYLQAMTMRLTAQSNAVASNSLAAPGNIFVPSAGSLASLGDNWYNWNDPTSEISQAILVGTGA